jgi:hypothetical protein
LKTIGLQHDEMPLLQEFMALDVDTLSQCPLGAAALSLRIGFRKAQATGENMFNTPAYFYASEIFDFFFSHAALEDIFSSGWPLFHQMSYIREFYFSHESAAVTSSSDISAEEKEWFATIEETLTQEGESIAPIELKQTTSMYMRDTKSISSRARAISALAMAENFLAIDDLDRAESVANQYISHAHRIFKNIVKSEGVSATMLFSSGGWPLAFYADRMTYRSRVLTPGKSLQIELSRSSWRLPQMTFNSSSAFEFSVFPYREMASDSLRTTRVPFCGMTPWVEEKFSKFSGEPRDARKKRGIQPIFG